MENHIWQLMFWMLLTLVGVTVSFGGLFLKNFIKRMDDNFNEIFAWLKYLAKEKDLEDVVRDVKENRERIIKLESKIQNCKSCNQ